MWLRSSRIGTGLALLLTLQIACYAGCFMPQCHEHQQPDPTVMPACHHPGQPQPVQPPVRGERTPADCAHGQVRLMHGK